MIATVAAFALFASTQGWAFADPPAETAPAAAASEEQSAKDKKAGNKDERFCRNEAPMGTRIPKVRCYVKQEFERRQLEEREHMRKMQADAQAPRFN